MARNRYIILYDIREDRRLRRIFNIMRSHGSRFQYSVFVCDLSPAELLGLRSELRATMNQNADSIAIVDLGPAEGPRSERAFEFLGVSPILPDQGSQVL